jgi:hypothetical protein
MKQKQILDLSDFVLNCYPRFDLAANLDRQETPEHAE